VKVDTAKPFGLAMAIAVLLKETRVSADGSESSAEQTLTYVDQDHCTFESANRTLNGDLQPNIDKIVN